jgi:hypothetical protein
VVWGGEDGDAVIEFDGNDCVALKHWIPVQDNVIDRVRDWFGV